MDIEAMPDVRMRGEMECHTKENDRIVIDYYSAWGDCHEFFDIILKERFPLLAEVTIAEECGNDVYINTDKEGRYYKERYFAEGENIDDHYCETLEEALEKQSEAIGKEFHTLREFREYVEENDLCSYIYEYACE